MCVFFCPVCDASNSNACNDVHMAIACQAVPCTLWSRRLRLYTWKKTCSSWHLSYLKSAHRSVFSRNCCVQKNHANYTLLHTTIVQYYYTSPKRWTWVNHNQLRIFTWYLNRYILTKFRWKYVSVKRRKWYLKRRSRGCWSSLLWHRQETHLTTQISQPVLHSPIQHQGTETVLLCPRPHSGT